MYEYTGDLGAESPYFYFTTQHNLTSSEYSKVYLITN